MDIQQFIQQTMDGNVVQAKDTLKDVLSARAYEALDAKKQQIAKTLYDNGESAEVQDTEDTENEEQTEE
jgi:hypothetical protein